MDSESKIVPQYFEFVTANQLNQPILKAMISLSMSSRPLVLIEIWVLHQITNKFSKRKANDNTHKLLHTLLIGSRGKGLRQLLFGI